MFTFTARESVTINRPIEGWLRIPGLFLKRFIDCDVQKELGRQFATLKQVLEAESVKERAA